MIVFCALLTWLLPGGLYVRSEVVVNGVTTSQVEFTHIDSQPQSWQVLWALYKGFVRQSGIIVFILVIGGAFWIVNSSRAIDAGIHSFLRKVTQWERVGWIKKLGVGNIVIVAVMLMFSLFGAIFGMSEETIAFTILLVPLAISLGYDSITGVCMVYVAAHVGFAGAILNPFTIGIAQGMAGLPLFSGIEYRFFCWVVLNVVSIAFVLWYARKVKRNPPSSLMYEDDAYWRAHSEAPDFDIGYGKSVSSWISYAVTLVVLLLFSIIYPHTTIKVGNAVRDIPWLIPGLSLIFAATAAWALRKSVQFYLLVLLGYTIVFLIVGVLGYEWYIGEISALFLAMGLLSGIAVGYTGNMLSQKFIEGAKDILSAALVVGLAGGIIVILEDGKVIDTILFKMSQAMDGAGKIASVGVMYVIQTCINIVIPSGSAKAALTMPIMAPFSDLIGVSRQATVMAFQFGDGFTNMITPTSGVLMGVLGMARIPYGKWFKWIWRFMLLLIILGFLLLIPTVVMSLNGFSGSVIEKGYEKEVKGHLFIIGGGVRTPELMERFVALAGGEGAKILVVPFASADGEETGAYLAEEFRGLGCVADYVVFEKGEADLEVNVKKLDGVTGVFFSGGDQNRLTDLLLGTVFLERIKEIYREGGVVGGTSAGAAVMSKVMITGDEAVNMDAEVSFPVIKRGNVVTAEGFGFIDFALIDQHFIQRKRENRLINLVIEHNLPGIGIDESTAVIFGGGRTFEVFGDRSVMVLEPQFTALPRSDKEGNLSVDGITLRLLLSGDCYTIK